MKIAMGCGWRNYGPEWFHVDGHSYDHVQFRDITLYDLPDNTVDIIYASHFIAYFSKDELKDLLKDWMRVLKKDGILRIATPDFHALHKVYDLTHMLDMVIGPLYGEMKMNGVTIHHKTAYTYKTLYAFLKECGFREIETYDWRQTEHADVDDHSQAYMLPKGDKEKGMLVSLNVQCKK